VGLPMDTGEALVCSGQLQERFSCKDRVLALVSLL
jgi:hypothetical protein